MINHSSLKMKLMENVPEDDHKQQAFLEYLFLLDTYGVTSNELKLKSIKNAEQFLEEVVLKEEPKE